MPKFKVTVKYIFERRASILEQHIIEANSKDEALELIPEFFTFRHDAIDFETCISKV